MHHVAKMVLTFAALSFVFKQGRSGMFGATAQGLFNTVS